MRAGDLVRRSWGFGFVVAGAAALPWALERGGPEEVARARARPGPTAALREAPAAAPVPAAVAAPSGAGDAGGAAPAERAPEAATRARPATLAGFRSLLADVLATKDPALAEMLIESLAAAGAASRAGLLELARVLLDPDEDVALRRAVAVALGRLPDPEALAALARVAGDPAAPYKVRGVAVLALGTDRHEGQSTVPPQVASTTGEGFRIAMGPVREPEALDALARMLRPRGRVEGDLALSALRALWETAGEARIDSAVVELAERSPRAVLRIEAVELLAQRDAGPDAFRVLVALAERDPEPIVRANAVAALSKYPYGGATEALARSLRAPEPPIRTAAKRALAAIADAPTISEAARTSARAALGL